MPTFAGARTLDAAGLANVLGETPSLNSYGGVPDGATDNRNQLQSLINAVSANGGGIARIPTGTWAISDYVTVPSNVWLVGAGPSSILKRVGTITSAIGTVNVSGTSVTWASGPLFTGLVAGNLFVITDGSGASVGYTIQAVNSSTSITLTTSAGSLSAASYYSNYGLLTITGSNVRLSDFTIDGQVTTSTPIDRGTISYPEQYSLIVNSSIWCQPGISHIRFNRITVTHSGGYGCFIDVRTANSQDYRFSDCTWVNNRPNTFTIDGTTGGSWTGCIYISGECTTLNPYYLNDIRVRDCTFSRNTGNCFWSHSYDFKSYHLFFRVSDCRFEDCGLDAVEFGTVWGGGVTNCNFHRIGYLTSTDTDTPAPAYAGVYGVTPVLFGAVCVDTSGYASGIAHANNSMLSVNGYGYNLDGMRDSTITGGTIMIPNSSSPFYTIDSISSYGVSISGTLTQISKGIETGNTSQNGGASNITITGIAISNMNQISISLVFAKYCTVSQCSVLSTSTITPPIVITGAAGGSGTEFCAFNNLVQLNSINYNQANVCIAESPVPSASVVYNNNIKDNQVIQ
jgi:hypothetical protein